MLQHQKGLGSLLFVFIFLYSGIIRGVITSDQIGYVRYYALHESDSKTNVSFQLNHFNTFSIVNPYKEKGESETDEVHFNFEIFFSSHSIFQYLTFPRFFITKEFRWFNEFELHLYDLFCNWKLHFR